MVLNAIRASIDKLEQQVNAPAAIYVFNTFATQAETQIQALCGKTSAYRDSFRFLNLYEYGEKDGRVFGQNIKCIGKHSKTSEKIFKVWENQFDRLSRSVFSLRKVLRSEKELSWIMSENKILQKITGLDSFKKIVLPEISWKSSNYKRRVTDKKTLQKLSDNVAKLLPYVSAFKKVNTDFKSCPPADIARLLNYFYWTRLASPDITTLIHFRATAVPDITPLGGVLGLKLNVDKMNADSVQNFIWVCKHIILTSLKPELEKEAKNRKKRMYAHATKSAIAAIMARNMSHNIGSHVLAKVSTNTENRTDEDKALFNYIQQRMDFIAQITTEFPAWTYSAWFLRNIMRHFYWQKQLLNNIALADGLSAYTYKGNKRKLIIQIRRKNSKTGKYTDIRNLHKDCLLAIPGGTVGLHAFYVILENFIRNAAKHNFATMKTPKEPFKIFVEYDCDSDNKNIKFRIWDNYSKGAKGQYLPIRWQKISQSRWKRLPLHQKINTRLVQSFIDDTGKLRKENWGLAEMKISAGYLQKKEIDKIADKGEPVLDIIKAICVEDDDGKSHRLSKWHLGYEFDIPRPKELLITGSDISSSLVEELENQSIYVKQEISENGNEDYEFCIMVDDEKNYFINNIIAPSISSAALKHRLEQLPCRLFVSIADSTRNNKFNTFIKNNNLQKRIVAWPNKDSISNIKGSTSAEFKRELYINWIQSLLRSRGNPKVVPTVRIAGVGNRNDEQTSVAKQHSRILENEVMRFCVDNKNRFTIQNIQSRIRQQIARTRADDEQITSCFADSKNKTWRDTFRAAIKKNFYEQYLPFAPNTIPSYFQKEDAPNTNINLESTLKTLFFGGNNSKGKEWEISYVRHGDDGVLAGKKAGYKEALSGVSAQFSLLSQPTMDLASKLCFQLAENGLIEILIIDERVADFAAQDHITATKLKAANVFVASDLKVGRKTLSLASSPYSHMEININPKKCSFKICGKSHTQKFDIAVVHQGVLDKIAEMDNGISHEDVVDILKTQIPFVVVATGRGEPHNLPENAKYLPFSSLQSFLMCAHHEKFLLTQTLMSLQSRQKIKHGGE